MSMSEDRDNEADDDSSDSEETGASFAFFLLVCVYYFPSCSQSVVVTKEPEANDTVCEVCEVITKVAELLVKYDNLTETEILDALLKVCGDLPQKLQPECNLLVKTVGKKIIEELVNGVPAEQVCSNLKLCSSSSSEEPIQEQPTIEQRREIRKLAFDHIRAQAMARKVYE